MKNILKFLTCLFVTSAIVGCNSKEEAITAILSSSDANVTIQDEGKNATATILAAGGSVEINVNEAASTWELVKEEDAEWCKVVEQGSKLTISASEFVSDYTRKTVLRVVLNNGAVAARIMVSQSGTDVADVVISSDKVEFTERGGTQTINVVSNYDWEVSGYEGLDWLSVTRTKSSITVTAPANAIQFALSKTLVIRAGTDINFKEINVDVIVAKRTPAYVTPIRDMVAVSKDGGEIRLAINSNREWEVTESADWFTATRDGDDVLIVADRNDLGGINESMLTITTIARSDNDVTAANSATVKQFDDPMIFEFTLSGSVDIMLPILGRVNCYIDWGDGTNDNLVATVSGSRQPKHTYENLGVYDVKIYGEVEALYCNAINTSRVNITALKKWGNLSLSNLNYGFAGTSIKSLPAGYETVMPKIINVDFMFTECSQLAEVPAGLFDGCNIPTSFTSVFWGCVALKSLPEGLLDGLTRLISANGTFRNSGIKTLPVGLFKNNTLLTALNSTFMECKSLTSLPADLFSYTPKVTSFLAAFAECSALTSVPATLFEKNINVTSFSRVFENCTSLSSVPAELFNTNIKANNFSQAFNGCTALTEIPGELFFQTPAVINFSGAFQNCSSLGYIPALLFDKCLKVTNFSSVFNGCENVTGLTPSTTISAQTYKLWQRSTSTAFSKPTLFSSCFKGCLKLSDYGDIPNNWK